MKTDALQKIVVEKAVGTVLAHDITRIIPGKFKGVGFKKGHIVQERDIPELLKLGKRHLYVLSLSPDLLHEDVAALRIARAVSGDNLHITDPVEGKSNILSRCDGLLKIDADRLMDINTLDDIIISTLKTNAPCRENQLVAATRIIPLIIDRAKIVHVESIARGFDSVIRIQPFRRLNVGAVVTGSEIYNGLINDEFDAYVGKKVEMYGSTLLEKRVAPDDPEIIAAAIVELMDQGCQLILTTGGLSVDPDDVTRQGIRRTGAEIIAYGAPVLPGAMFLYAQKGPVTILGLPACVFYHPATIFDLMLPRVLAGERIIRRDLAAMGHGGLCMNCESCVFPSCPFGK